MEKVKKAVSHLFWVRLPGGLAPCAISENVLEVRCDWGEADLVLSHRGLVEAAQSGFRAEGVSSLKKQIKNAVTKI